MRFLLSKLVSVGLLFALLLIPIHLVLSQFSIPGIYSICAAFALILLIWWFSGAIYDAVFSGEYGVRWVSMKALEERDYALTVFIRDALLKHDLRLAWIGIAEDDRPICITYGESRRSIRLIISSGVFRHLQEGEVQAMVAHEIGHMQKGDFITLSTVYLPAFLLYIPARALWRNSRRFNPLLPLGMLFYFGHWLFTIPLLLLSRLREYHADEFACENSTSNGLGIALCKISLAYISQSGRPKSINFMEASRPFAMLDYKMARSLALAYLNVKETGSWILAENICIQDIYTPWPAFFEFFSTHPLPGKRLMLTCLKAEQLGGTAFLDMQRMFATQAGMLFKLNFIEDFIIYLVARLSPIVIALLLAFGYFYDVVPAAGFAISLYGLGIALISLYSFSYLDFKKETVKMQLTDSNVSPIKGRPLELEGVIREKSSLGLDLPEELLFADHSGEIFIGPRSLMPLVISPYISAGSLMKLKDRKVKVRGWYLHGRYPKLIIDEVVSESASLKARQRLFDLGLASLVISIGIVLMML